MGYPDSLRSWYSSLEIGLALTISGYCSLGFTLNLTIIL